MFAEAAKLTLSQYATEVGTVRDDIAHKERSGKGGGSANELKGMKDRAHQKSCAVYEDIPDKLIKVRKGRAGNVRCVQAIVKGYGEDPNKVGPDEFSSTGIFLQVH